MGLKTSATILELKKNENYMHVFALAITVTSPLISAWNYKNIWIFWVRQTGCVPARKPFPARVNYKSLGKSSVCTKHLSVAGSEACWNPHHMGWTEGKAGGHWPAAGVHPRQESHSLAGDDQQKRTSAGKGLLGRRDGDAGNPAFFSG